ncbi:substrate-binding domain-containing protein [Halapricum hydrolyticum]|uniref:Substrate-binding domain-containing protein n=1 Tax=Halapricum hydrolyticum TaxID=2979991 RepID=A0AAE3I9C6_9EURY|nr:substrate-binding domain-containing protein [Halapricum hydrolyticum]MCU4717289.1 substrate-binding domain-containing protein [Halapricum hydrolyticum]MCU4726216.1 substrate-binding domain-containing protein [Halapricum hydrolyticum]
MEIQRRRFLAGLGAGTAAIAAGCVRSGADSGAPDVVGETLTLTTTTSTYDTGLLDEIHPDFEARYGVSVDAIAQGTGAALESARNGDSDVVMVHARDLEDEFMRNGYGVNRRDLMFNDFVVVGPETDPAGIEGTSSATAALAAIAEARATFVSRGDNSGTHAKERNLWEGTQVEPGGDWYQETGTGMGEALNIANQQGAYTLSDRGTYLSQRSNLDLTILVQGPIEDGPEALSNPYGVMAVNPAVHGNVNYDLAMAYIGWLTSPDVQDAISDYERNGEQLFFPEALSEDPNFQQYVPEGWRSDSTAE